MFQGFPHNELRSVLLFKFFYDCELRVRVEVVARVTEVLANVKAVGSWDVVPVFIYAHVHRPLAFPNILGPADNAFHQVYYPFALAVDFVEYVVGSVRAVAFELRGAADLSAAFVISLG